MEPKALPPLLLLAKRLARSLKYYSLVNGLNVAVAWASAGLLRDVEGSVATLLALYAAVLLRVAVMVSWFEFVGTHKRKILGDKRHALTPAQRRAIYWRILWLVVPTEMAMLVYALPRLRAQIDGRGCDGFPSDALTPWSSLVEFAAFIPKSLVFEIAFDLFHYVAHWSCHQVPWIYQHVHKRHHLHLHPCALSTFEQDSIDLLLTNVMPFVLASQLSPAFSPFQLHLLFSYKTYVEVAGHCGLEVKGLSFPQMPLVSVLGICMRVHDHDLHHTHPKANFAKRFALWDKIFGTFQRGREVEQAPTTAMTNAVAGGKATGTKEVTPATAPPPQYY